MKIERQKFIKLLLWAQTIWIVWLAVALLSHQ
jgi:hypothetical protein